MEKRRIKIMYILPSLSSGGAERFILDLMYNLDQSLFQTELLLFKDSGFFYPEAWSKGLSLKVLKKKFKLDPLNLWRIYRHIKQSQPDIVHTELGGDIYGKLAAKLAGVKVIISTEQNVRQNDRPWLLRFKKITARWSNKIVAISAAVREDLIKEYGLNSDRVELIYNGLDLDKFSGDGFGRDRLESDPIIIGSIGRLTPQKNFSLLLRALAQVKNRNFKCLIAGEGDLRQELEAEIKELGLSRQVELPGLISEVSGFLNSLDLFVLPSRWEGLGITLLEAGLAKLPVLASATGGILDVIKDRHNGRLFKNEDLNDLINKLDYCLDSQNQDYLRQLGEKLRSDVAEKFDIKRIAEQYQNLYKTLVQ